MRFARLAICALGLSSACPARERTPAESADWDARSPEAQRGQAHDDAGSASRAKEPHDSDAGCTTGRDCEEQGIRAYDHGDYVSARLLFERACQLNDPLGCRRLSLDLDHDRGPAAPADPPRAQTVLEKACELGEHDSCGMLATGYLYGNRPGVARDPERGAKLFQKACDGGDGASCEGLANCYADGLGVAKDRARARKLRKRAAELGYVGE